jgi:hypothetical protein
VRVLDTEEIFAMPVAEAYPEVAAAYNAVIEDAMDLRTIEEDHIHMYESIKELQQDLILIFRNCCTFNVANSEYWHFAK